MKYVPFLKLKQNEVIAFRRLDILRRGSIVPLFDLPRKKDITGEEFKEQVKKGLNYITRASERFIFSFYLDVFDIPDTIYPDGKHIYQFVLDEFTGTLVIPVVGLDRHDDHILAARNFMNLNQNPKHFAIRLSKEDIVSYKLTHMNIDLKLSGIIDDSDVYDLIIDLRLIEYENIDNYAQKIVALLDGLIPYYNFNKIIIASSTIPANIAQLVKVKKSKLYYRNEWLLWEKILTVKKKYSQYLTYGDYTVVTPEFTETDIDPKLISSRQTPRILYTSPDSFFIIRGAALKTSGYDQYYDLAKKVVNLSFYRGNLYSRGDRYIHEVSNHVSKSCGNAGSWIASTINCHLSLMADILQGDRM